MSHPNPQYEPENSYPDDNFKPVAKKHKQKKASMAKKMGPSAVDKLKRLIGESENMRKNPLKWFKEGQGDGGLPPGRTDKDNE